MERTSKKVDEGIEQFEEYLAKLNASTTAAQKERWEGEMKKEVKRLQRLRDQIKVWQTSNEIKNKDPLNETRRKIEVLMERFKVLEKDLKIKAYSKEGLSAISKVDPKEKEKAELMAWIGAAIDRLKTIIDAIETELELLSTSGKRQASKTPKQKELETRLSRHHYHIVKLELVCRMLENEHLVPEDLAALRDFMDDYLENCENPDYIEDDSIYSDFDFTALEAEVLLKPTVLSASNSDEEGHNSDVEVPPPPLHEQQQVVLEKGEPSNRGGGLLKKPPAKHAEPVTVASAHIPSVATTVASSTKVWSNVPKSIISPENPTKKSSTPVTIPSEETKESIPSFFFSPTSCYHFSSDVISDPFLKEVDAMLEAKITKNTKAEFFQSAMDDEFFKGLVTPKKTGNKIWEKYNFPQVSPFSSVWKHGLMEKFEVETLFAIFYYLPHTYAQYLAARELKKQSWRYHKKYLTWFQRHEEPTVITEDFEQGTYVYFDYESSWCQRKKSEFTFEYRFLEDAELV